MTIKNNIMGMMISGVLRKERARKNDENKIEEITIPGLKDLADLNIMKK
jgi:hypothetical protein